MMCLCQTFVRRSKLNAPSVSVSANLSGFPGPSNSGSNETHTVMANNADASQFEGEQAVMSACIQSDPISGSQVRGQKRKRYISNWKRNIAKRRRNEGKSSINSSGKEISCKVMK